MKQKHLIWLLLMGFSPIFAQKQGKFALAVPVPDAFVKMDDAPAEKLGDAIIKTFTLTEGVHRYQIWAAGFQLLSDTVTIVADRTTRRTVNLKQTEAFVKYREQMARYAVDRGMAAGSTVFLLAANVGLTWFVGWQGRGQAGENLEALKKQKRLYEQSGSIASLSIARQDFNEAETKYHKSVDYYNRKLAIGVPLTLASYYATYRVIKKLRKKATKKPEFHDKNPLSNVDFQVSPSYGIVPTGGFGLNLNVKF
jgi:hypothetical protein